MKYLLKKYSQTSFLFILSLCLLNNQTFGADETNLKRTREEGDVSLLTLPQEDITSQKGHLQQNISSVWKESLNFNYTLYSSHVEVDSWHHGNANLISAIQKELVKVTQTPNTNVAIAGVQCVYNEINGDTFGITRIINLPKIFVSGYKARLTQNFSTFIDQACSASFSSSSVQIIKDTFEGVYGIGDGYIYSGFDHGYPHSRAYMAQNFNLWLGESSHLSRTYLRNKLQIIQKDGVYNIQFAESYFHSEQAVLAYLESEIGMDFLFRHFFNKIPEVEGRPQITQIILHMSSYYDVCNTCADTLFRESEAGRMFLGKLNSRLKAQYYLYPQNHLSLLTETSGILEYRKGGTTTRPTNFENTAFYRSPLVSIQTPPYVMRMKIGERK